MAAELFITCPCSQKLSVTPADCGGTLRCTCGRMVDVPRLSDVREMSRLEAIDIGIVNRIKQLVAEGVLPVEQKCARCNSATADTVLCEIECEKITVKGHESIWKTLLLAILVPWGWVQFFIREPKDLEFYGREISLTVPIRVCHQCVKKLRRSKRQRVDALRKTDLYRELFSKYPDAVTKIIQEEPLHLKVTPSDNSNPYSYR